jgi:hypothetical protein
MHDVELASRAADLIKAIPYLNLATCAADHPWSSPVYAVYDQQLNFYWSSWKEAAHSVNVASNPVCAFTIYDSTRPRGTNNYRCLYVECRVITVTDPDEAQMASQMLYPGETTDLSNFLSDGLKRFYKAMPLKAWLNCLSERDLTPATIKMRVEVDLSAIRAAT